MIFHGLELDPDAQRFLEMIAAAMQQTFSIPEAEAVGRIRAAWLGRRIDGDAILYHEPPEFWAKALYFGRRDFWRHKDLVPVPYQAPVLS